MKYYVYILTNITNHVLYTGVTSNIEVRTYIHQHGLVDGFTKKYNVHKLVYIEYYPRMIETITREKQIKAGSRKSKIRLIESLNPGWRDLSHYGY